MILIKDQHGICDENLFLLNVLGNMILIKSEFWRLGLQFFIIVFT